MTSMYFFNIPPHHRVRSMTALRGGPTDVLHLYFANFKGFVYQIHD